MCRNKNTALEWVYPTEEKRYLNHFRQHIVSNSGGNKKHFQWTSLSCLKNIFLYIEYIISLSA